MFAGVERLRRARISVAGETVSAEKQITWETFTANYHESY
jgi:hypothetical protein